MIHMISLTNATRNILLTAFSSQRPTAAGVARPGVHLSENATKLGAAGVCELLLAALKTHVFSVGLVEWVCAGDGIQTLNRKFKL